MIDKKYGELVDETPEVDQPYDRDWLPEELRLSVACQLQAKPDTILKFKVMSTYAINALRISRHGDLARRLGFSIRGSNALLAAFSSCHLFMLSPRQMVETGLWPLMAKAWLVILDLGDDILDEYVSHRMPAAAAIEMAREMRGKDSATDKAAVFIRFVDSYLTDADRRAISAKFFGADDGSLGARLIEAFDFRGMVDDCKRIDGERIDGRTASDLEHSLAFFFDVCIHSYALERTTSARSASVEDVIKIYRAKSLYFQYAYMGIAEAFVRGEGVYVNHAAYIQRLKRVGAYEMERSMFRDDVNDLVEDILKCQPNLIFSIALSLGKSREFLVMLRLALEGRTFSLVTFRTLMPETYARYLELQDAERVMLGMRRKPIFSHFLAVCTSICSVGWWATLRHHFRIMNPKDAGLGRIEEWTEDGESLRLACLVSGEGRILDRIERFGVRLTTGGATIVTLLARRGDVTVDAIPLLTGFVEQARQCHDEESSRNWQRVILELTASCGRFTHDPHAAIESVVSLKCESNGLSLRSDSVPPAPDDGSWGT